MRLFYTILFSILFISCLDKNSKNQSSIRDSLEINKAKGALCNDQIKGDSVCEFRTIHTFEKYKAIVYNGVLAEPRITNELKNDSQFVSFITNGCKKYGINFAGHYTVLEYNCGAECLWLFIVNRINGKILNSPDSLKEGKFGYKFHKDSKLLIANAYLFRDDSLKYYDNYWCKPELYELKNDSLIMLH